MPEPVMKASTGRLSTWEGTDPRDAELQQSGDAATPSSSKPATRRHGPSPAAGKRAGSEPPLGEQPDEQ